MQVLPLSEKVRGEIKAFALEKKFFKTLNNVLNEKGGGYKKVREKLEDLEKEFLEKQRERTKNLGNLFRRKLNRPTPGGTILKAGVAALDHLITKKLK